MGYAGSYQEESWDKNKTKQKTVSELEAPNPFGA